ncbi:MAG: hypothetical protein ACM3JB_06750 [Acidobacteriaceae bacterium]
MPKTYDCKNVYGQPVIVETKASDTLTARLQAADTTPEQRQEARELLQWLAEQVDKAKTLPPLDQAAWRMVAELELSSALSESYKLVSEVVNGRHVPSSQSTKVATVREKRTEFWQAITRCLHCGQEKYAVVNTRPKLRPAATAMPSASAGSDGHAGDESLASGGAQRRPPTLRDFTPFKKNKSSASVRRMRETGDDEYCLAPSDGSVI